VSGPLIPIRTGSGPDRRRLSAEDWARGRTFLEFVEAAGDRRARLEAAFRRAAPSAAHGAIVAASPRLRIAAFAGDRDAAINAAHGERLAAAGERMWLRVFDPHTCADLMQRFELDGATVAFFVEDGRRCARWGPHPAALRTLLDAVPPELRTAFRDAWYEASDGCDLAAEWCELVRACAGLLAPAHAR
jgi:hypothetical protein